MSQRTIIHDRVIALSALMQSVTLVQQIAETGQVDNDDMQTMLQSLLVMDAPDTESVYGEISKLTTGIRQFNNQLSKRKQPGDIVVLRYAIGILHLQRKLAKRPAMLDLITRELDQIPQQIEYFGSITSPQVIARFADIYQRTVSELTPRIQVFGDSTYLQQADNVNRIRALLLSGIRAAVLWQQKGGRRWQFLLQSNKLLQAATDLHAQT
ncbi:MULTISPECIES: high frequency lysogenization protein HflD [unclassified Methylophaga]|jgi:high frequency lysogenization protein|nr:MULTISPECIES: high frequency lysogenization protein HflD [unclassified Methylophaga]MAL49496.1 lysogenization regulator HflD [Methylophaga sp.]MAP25719.1 lysogenization regulator HflD [Methylophaga sp.]MBP25078.1 lysogenization regulator HflD [Methylophaga sp.]HAD31075.1 lysogenization regulator HflD [Methylophaga sp.]HCC81564.1 lysogenization regulator HflD [Methylophaga sp.]|tara:strand:+ start:997 stop:1629 length:633 start_codon:yes stop_codon:yes gene_type:complete